MDVLPPTPAPYSSIARLSSITFVARASMIRIKMCGVPREAGVKTINAGKSSKSASKSAGKTRVSKRTAVDTQTIADLVAANRILYAQGVLDGYGHVSARHDLHPDRFWLSRGMAPGLVTADDIMEFDLSGEPIDARGRSTYAERFIHSEIYRHRPDVKAIVHSHSPAVIPFGVTSVPLKPIFHMSGFLGTGVPIFEIRETAGDTDMLVRNPALGEALALRLNDKPAALMRGHGSVAVGISQPQVVFRAIYLEVNARLQSEATKLGNINFLTSEEARLAAAENDIHLLRPWMLWKHEIAKGKSA
jgi:ribulose-5-phosphate 4-epimerase/fuculose-1-phosphate aldolase